jgi:hypothetical protein
VAADVREPVDVAPLIELRRLQPPGKPDAVARIVGHFLAETSERLARLQAAVAAHDAHGIERGAHALKGIAGTVGANELLDLAAAPIASNSGSDSVAVDLVTSQPQSDGIYALYFFKRGTRLSNPSTAGLGYLSSTCT